MDSLTDQQRLSSLDALRGFDMFWIMGGEEIFHSLYKATGSPLLGWFTLQLSHPNWHGFRIYDLIFPMFLFIAGVATPYSVARQRQKGASTKQILWKVTKRGLLLVLFGVIYNNGLHLRPFADIRFPSVLGRIGLAYLFANIIYLYTSKELTRVIWCVGILIGYWLVLMTASAPGFAHGDLTMEGNFTSYVDRLFMPGKLYLGIHDPEGIFATIPAVATGLIGILTGEFLKNSTVSKLSKAKRIFLSGLVLFALARIWDLVFPINKNLWTSSFVLQAAGLSLFFLSIFYFIMDVRGFRKWAFFFTVIGTNAILIYLSTRFIDWGKTTKAFFEWLMQLAGDPWDMVVFAFCLILVKWVFLYILYRKKIFLRV